MSLSRISKISTELDSDLIIGGNWFLDMNSGVPVVLLGIKFGGRLILILNWSMRSRGERGKLDGPVLDLSKAVVGETNGELTRCLNVSDGSSAEFDMINIFTGTVIFDNFSVGTDSNGDDDLKSGKG
jgi:hypothetical protein